jgi:hypothetical protein
VEGGGGVARTRRRRVTGRRIRKREAEEGVWGRKPETKPSWLGFGSAVSNGSARWWWVVVGWRVQGDRGRRAARSQTRGGGVGWRVKTRNRARRLGFGPHLGTERRRGVLWAHKTPFRNNLGCDERGVRWYGRRRWVCPGCAHLVTYDPSCLSCLALPFPLPSLITPTPSLKPICGLGVPCSQSIRLQSKLK